MVMRFGLGFTKQPPTSLRIFSGMLRLASIKSRRSFLKMREPHCNYAWQGLRLNRIGQLFLTFG